MFRFLNFIENFLTVLFDSEFSCAETKQEVSIFFSLCVHACVKCFETIFFAYFYLLVIGNSKIVIVLLACNHHGVGI